MEHQKRGNLTLVTHFILLGFQDLKNLQILLFLGFLLIYIVTIAGNFLIAVVVVTDQHLHTPMYFFLGNLSCLEICYSSTLIPVMLETLLRNGKTISFSSCFLQLFFFGYCLGAECYLLSVMSYDRYLAICKPLHYGMTMSTTKCIQLAAVSWINGLIGISIIMVLMLQLTYCGPNEIDHYFCDTVPLKKLSCSDTGLVECVNLILLFVYTMPPFLVTCMSYVFIIMAIVRISSTTGRQKAFSTCSSHLIVVSTYYGSLMTVYLLPNSSTLNKAFSLLYTILPPLVNPLIYSLRNKEVNQALRQAQSKLVNLRIFHSVLAYLVNAKEK
ncbi:olfactory receptor 2AP1-like [Sphaerodactylus townsendi]|uniref:olfactory receptor 2AP1-like n=1 Tax=Sphaerodactylus townsendi TaxID=933632 RepID=UPI00202729B3|nr:olfactory receptor 2AP1-like [Sphaerodactylus townsendi]